MLNIPSSSKSIPLDLITTARPHAEATQAAPFRLIHDDFVDLDCCDYCFGLERGGISEHYEHPQNIIHLQKDFLELFFEAGWVVIPTQTTLERIHAFYHHNDTAEYDDRKSVFESFPDKSYTFILVPLQLSTPIYYRDPDTSAVRQCDHPYTDLPLVTTTANPYIVFAFFRQAVRVMLEVRLPPEMERLHDAVQINWLIKPPLTFFQRGRHLDSIRGPQPSIFNSTVDDHYEAEQDDDDVDESVNGERPLAQWRQHTSLQEEDESIRITRWIKDCPHQFSRDPYTVNLGAYAAERSRPMRDALAGDPLWLAFVKESRVRWDTQKRLMRSASTIIGKRKQAEASSGIGKRKRVEPRPLVVRTRLRI